MKKTRIAINGFGRIGRAILRIISARDDMEVVAVNDLYPSTMLAYLLRYDTVMGTFEQEIAAEPGALLVGGRRIQLIREKDPGKLPWAAIGVDIAVEATGIFRDRARVELHRKAGAKKVILTVPPKDDLDAIVVLGVNDSVLTPASHLVSNASCTDRA